MIKGERERNKKGIISAVSKGDMLDVSTPGVCTLYNVRTVCILYIYIVLYYIVYIYCAVCILYICMYIVYILCCMYIRLSVILNDI